MNRPPILPSLFILLLLLHPRFAIAQGTAFTYQGQLTAGTNLATGNYDLTFAVFSDSNGVSQIGETVTNLATAVNGGLFTATLDFGPGIFTGSSLWLQIGVETNGNDGDAYTLLTPLQSLTPSPYSIYSATAGSAGYATAATTAYGVPAGSVSAADIAPASVVKSLNNLQDAVTLVPGANITITPGGNTLTIASSGGGGGGGAGAAYLNASQTFTGANIFDTGIGSGALIVQGAGSIDTSLFTGLGFQYEEGSGEGAIISSYDDGLGFLTFYTKQASGDPIARQVIIDNYGGVAIDQQNANGGVIDNGTTNGAGLTFGISSGEGIASERTPGPNTYGLDFYTLYTQRMSLNNGGNLMLDGNDLWLLGPNSSSLGGRANYGLGYRTSVAGISPAGGDGPFLYGYDAGYLGTSDPEAVSLWWDYYGDVWVSNNLSVASLTVRNGLTVPPGGYVNFGAQAGQMLDLYTNSVTCYAIGVQNQDMYFRCGADVSGTGFAWFRGGQPNSSPFTSGGGSTLMTLTTSGLTVNGTFVSASDRNLKEHFSPVDSRSVLEKVDALPIQNWNYKADTVSRHIGPMAQDFYAAFNVGPDDKHIAVVDEGGVALAAIQGLNQKLEAQMKEKDARIADLEKRLNDLAQTVQNLTSHE